jgi:hypothetical protein
MAERKLETLVQSVLARNFVVAGSERIGTRLADRATPTFLPFAWLPSTDADAESNPHVNRGQPAMTQSRGLRAGRSARSTGSLRSRLLRLRDSRRQKRWSWQPSVTATYAAAYCAAGKRLGGKRGTIN